MGANRTHEQGPVIAAEGEQSQLDEVKSILAEEHAPKLVSAAGEATELPPSIVRLLRQVIPHLAHNQAVAVVPINKELTTQEAAEILNVSRPYLIKVLERGEIPYVMTGTHRRILVSDLMDYKRKRDTSRREALARLTQISQDFGMYSE
ncbi:MAG: hypothetical protein OJF49_004124 [Ktedonobacterales bacterium]|jgi:excisionase family DNA binding protein|nr:MAG: hypothetical protein OJF49_004124 [Ktedonobacterales bacterium]